MQKSKKAKINEKFRSDYLAVNIRETDIYEEGRTEGIALGISQGISQGIAQGIAQGISQGAEQKAIETARNMLKYGDSTEKVVIITGLSLKIVEQLAKEQTSQNQREIQE